MKNLALLSLFLTFSLVIRAQDYAKISDAFSDGNASAIGRMFDATVEFSLDGNLSTLGRADAENRLRSFFIDNEPRTFEIVHKGTSKSEVHYAIGQLVTASGAFRVTLYLHESLNTHRIQSIEIEHD